MPVILFLDLLGARKKWVQGGVAEATEAFNHFTRMVVRAIREEPPGSVLGGGIETDSAMILFDNPLSALHVANRLFRWAFESNNSPRFWLRGSLVRANDDGFLRRESRMAEPFDQVGIFTYSPPALDAISIEKSGFKGMRLLVRPDALDSSTRDALKIPFGQESFIPLKHLEHSYYPPAFEGDFLDFLWMACADDREWNVVALHMTSRLRHAAKDAEEFAQAAATQVVFHECAAIRQSLANKAQRQLLRTHGRIERR